MSVKCAKEGCSFKKSMNAYCGKHQSQYFLETTTVQGLKVCSNYIRGCKVQNPMDYTYSKCEICLKKEREKDKVKRSAKVETEQGKKQCSACSRISGLEDFQGKRGETSTCNSCRESNKRADAKRDKEHIQELARTNAKKPERKAVKQAWKEKNVEKCAKYWIDARKRLIEKNLEGYLKKNAEQAKKWREANPEKVKIINQDRNDNIEYHYTNYKRSALSKRLEFEISVDIFMTMVKQPCYYCGTLQEKGFNGIDRVDSTRHYVKENCVSCCEMCNMMKGTTGPSIFVHRVEHILTNLTLIEGNLYPDDFANIATVSYSIYNHRAKDRDICFDLTKEQFLSTINMSCYICGKENNEFHQNGIDRFDNTKGYVKENIRGCCGNCNYLKRNYEYELFINKLKFIYENQKACPIHENNNKELHNIVPGNKLTMEEKKLSQAIRKKSQQDTLINKYTNEDIKKKWISEIVQARNS
jgi:hypothetical protein